MNVNMTPKVGTDGSIQDTVRPAGLAADGADQKQDFASLFTDALQQVNSAEVTADRALVDLALGRSDDIAGAVIEAEKAQLAFGATLKIRQEALEAYDKVMRMPI